MQRFSTQFIGWNDPSSAKILVHYEFRLLQLVSCLAYSSILNMEAIRFSETTDSLQTTECYARFFIVTDMRTSDTITYILFIVTLIPVNIPMPKFGVTRVVFSNFCHITDLTREWSDPTCRNLPWFFFFHCKSTHNKIQCQNFSC
jgi:hypothetical protein